MALVVLGAWGASECCRPDDTNDSIIAPVSYQGQVLPDWRIDATPTPTPNPTPPPTPAPSPLATLTPAPTRAGEPDEGHVSDSGAQAKPEQASDRVEEPQEPAGGALVEGIPLTVYSCYGDSTGAYCPWGNEMACGGAVHRGAAACGYQWACGQQFRILGDPFPDMVYTCLDRGGAVTGIDVWFMDYYAEGRAWRVQLPQPVTVELLD